MRGRGGMESLSERLRRLQALLSSESDGKAGPEDVAVDDFELEDVEDERESAEYGNTEGATWSRRRTLRVVSEEEEALSADSQRLRDALQSLGERLIGSGEIIQSDEDVAAAVTAAARVLSDLGELLKAYVQSPEEKSSGEGSVAGEGGEEVQKNKEKEGEKAGGNESESGKDDEAKSEKGKESAAESFGGIIEAVMDEAASEPAGANPALAVDLPEGGQWGRSQE